MAQKRIPIIVDKLIEDPKLETMLADLDGGPAVHDADGVRSARWSKRFAASGKQTCAKAPRIRMSYEK